MTCSETREPSLLRRLKAVVCVALQIGFINNFGCDMTKNKIICTSKTFSLLWTDNFLNEKKFWLFLIDFLHLKQLIIDSLASTNLELPFE